MLKVVEIALAPGESAMCEPGSMCYTSNSMFCELSFSFGFLFSIITNRKIFFCISFLCDFVYSQIRRFTEVKVKMSATSMFGSSMTSESMLKPKYTNTGDEAGFVAFTPNMPVSRRVGVYNIDHQPLFPQHSFVYVFFVFL